ncbi:MAG TPA: class II fumarate hydratase [Oligoflexia bacterium]|nr:class II fumarate hydratase [Oligoflexia bacterium]
MTTAEKVSKDDAAVRIEHDFLGPVRVPVDAYYSAQTQRAAENFPISESRFPRSFIRALALIKRCAAVVNSRLGLLEPELSELIGRAAREVEEGSFDRQFVVDIFQSGSATSTNMNANEVIARRGAELSGGARTIHKNDHVNMSQSSNDVIPSAIHIAAACAITTELLPALHELRQALVSKAAEFSGILKVGRTHLQDAVPIALGQEFSGYAAQVQQSQRRIERALVTLYELPLGGTAVGTGINAHSGFRQAAIDEISRETKLPFIPALNSFEAQAARDGLVEMSGQLRTTACSLIKIGNDIRWMGSGPVCGLGELLLPEVQPGSSIMPGKVNPVIVESLLMVCVQVIGNDTAVALGGGFGGSFELNTMMPVMARNILESINLLSAACSNFSRRCIEGLAANPKRLAEYCANNASVCTLLAPRIGYDQAAEIVREAYAAQRPFREVILERKLLSAEELDELLSAEKLTQPHNG